MVPPIDTQTGATMDIATVTICATLGISLIAYGCGVIGREREV